MANIGTGLEPVNIAFSKCRNAVLIERKMLHCTTLSIKLHHYTLSEIKNPSFCIVRRPCLCLNTLRGSETTLEPGLFKKSNDITLQTCVDTANEYLQAYNRAVDVRRHGFCSLHQCKCAGYAMFLKTFLRSN